MSKKQHPPSSWGASYLLDLLRVKHEEDIFVPECHLGSQVERRMDAWAMRRSWSPWETIGYEIKVSRQDFDRDDKWVEYLPCCHKFYFVCPAGLIRANDIPQGIGLMWMTVSGSRLMTKVPAVRRDVEPKSINRLMTYVLMSRTRIVANMYEANDTEVLPKDVTRRSLRCDEYISALARHVRNSEARGELAEIVRGHIRARIAEADRRLKDAQSIEAQNSDFERRLAEMGLEWKDRKWTHVNSVVRQAEALAGVIKQNGYLSHACRNALNSLGKFLDEYDAALNGEERKEQP